MQAVIALCRSILSRHPIAPRNVVGHSDVAPQRKEDPGELFGWAWLAREGVGLFPDCALNANAISDGYVQQLAEYGYQVDDLPKAVLAFQRHFRPARLNGEWDGECQAILDWLLARV